MKQIYDFDRYPPPVLNENMLRDKLEKRSKKRPSADRRFPILSLQRPVSIMKSALSSMPKAAR